MDKLIVLVLLCAITFVHYGGRATSHKATGKWRGARRRGWNCFPDNATKARCFADVPNAGHKARSWLMHFLPQADEDSYVFNGTTTLDTEDFVVSRIEEDPKYLCLAQDAFVASMSCLSDSIKAKCPFLPESVTGQYVDFAKGMTYICSRIHELDTVCLHTHSSSMKPCMRSAMKEMRQDFDRLARDWRHSHHKQGHEHSRRGRKGFARPGSNVTSAGTNSSASSANNSTASGGRGWWKGPRTGVNVTAENRTVTPSMSARELLLCRFNFVMLQCVRRQTAQCHGNTADIMHDFMKGMNSPPCRAKMDDWEEAHVMEQVADCHGNQCSAAWRLAAPRQGPLLCVLVFLLMKF